MDLNRRGFLRTAAAAIAVPASLRARAASAQPLVRVLLGRGEAQALAGGGFEFDGRQYRGSFSRSPDGSIVNVVALEDYLYSIVPREMPSSWPPAALQMQAICSRTFVVAHSDPRRPYDVGSSQLSQVYQGVAAESEAGREAVDGTAGRVVLYGAAYANVEYSSCCGGHTESAADAWGGSPVAYLNGVPCPYCTQAPDYRWTSEIPLTSIEQALPTQLTGLGALRDVRLGASDASGRVREFTLIADRGRVVVQGSDFRLAVGGPAMRSLLLFKSETRTVGSASLLHLEGGGNGHGVGLCQWGSRGMALADSSAPDIASFYFPVPGIASFYFPGTSLGSIRG